MSTEQLKLAVDSREVDEAKLALDKLALAAGKTEAATGSLEAEYRDATAELNRMKAAQEAMTMQMGRATVTMGGANATSRAMQANMLNLSRQGADVATMFALGAPPMQIFASQGAQIVDVLAMMRTEAKATGTSLTAMSVSGLAKMGPYALAAAAAVGAVSIAMSGLTDRINENSQVQVTWGDVALGTYDVVTEYLGNEMTTAFKSLGLDVNAVWGDIVDGAINAGNMLVGTFVASHRLVLAAWQTFPAAFAELIIDGVNWGISALERLANGSIDMLNSFAAQVNGLVGSEVMGQISRLDIPEVENGFAGAGRRAGAAMAGAAASAFHDYFGDLAGGISEGAQNRARTRLNAAGEELGRDAGRTAGRAASGAIADEVGGALEDLKAAAVAESANAKAIQDKNKAGIDNLRRKTEAEMAALEEVAERERELMRETADIARQQLDNLIASSGSFMGALLGLASGNVGAVGGSIGGLLNIGTGTKTDAQGKVIARNLGDELRTIFKLEGEFGKTMTSLLQGAGTGSLAATAVFGKQDTASALGSSIGGALGQEAGKQILGALGSAAGPIGSIVGGIVGSLAGGLLSSTKYGTANLTGAGAASISAKGSGRADSATGLAGSVQGALQDIADLLGGTVGGYNVSIGTYKDSYRVSASGKTGKLKGGDVKDFGTDSASAIAFALADAIKDGAVDGVAESVKALLGSGSDVQKQIDKALKFQGVFASLLEATDPAAYALKQVTDQFADLRKIFDEAGASAAEYADLEKLLALKRAEAVEAAKQSKLDDLSETFNLQIRMLELLGKGEEALTASRILEVAGMKAALQPMQAMIYELEDARSVIDKFGPLGDSLRDFKEELLGQSGNGGFAAIAAQFRATAAGAAVGDADALAGYREAGTAYLEAAKDNAISSLEYNRAVSEVLAGADKGIFAADMQVEMAQRQIDAIANQTNVLEQMRVEMRDANIQIASNTNALLTLWKRFEGDGLTVKTQADTPLVVVAS